MMFDLLRGAEEREPLPRSQDYVVRKLIVRIVLSWLPIDCAHGGL